jgi:phosphoglycolate phosphatase-like HAD superfamily hydrolase
MYRTPIKPDAILWDFDGTLANSAAKNIAITRQILEKVAPQLTGANLPNWLKTESDYHKANHGAENWRDLYRNYFGMSDEDITAAGPMWKEYQARDKTVVKLFDGILETILKLADIPMGISSANSSCNINNILNYNDINSYFKSVVGYETFPPEAQKPVADPGLKCLDEVLDEAHQEIQGKTIVYIGDHIADVIFARNIAKSLGPDSTVISVVVTYSGAEPESWRVKPDELIADPKELTSWFAG